MFVTCQSFTDIQIYSCVKTLFFASVQFSNVVTSETPLWLKLATMYLLLISSHVTTENHGYISYQCYTESEGK